MRLRLLGYSKRSRGTRAIRASEQSRTRKPKGRPLLHQTGRWRRVGSLTEGRVGSGVMGDAGVRDQPSKGSAGSAPGGDRPVATQGRAGSPVGECRIRLAPVGSRAGLQWSRIGQMKGSTRSTKSGRRISHLEICADSNSERRHADSSDRSTPNHLG